MIGNDPIGHPALDQIARHMALVGIHEAADDLIVSVLFRREPQPILIQKSLRQHPIQLLSDPPVPPVDQIVDDCPSRQRSLPQIPPMEGLRKKPNHKERVRRRPEWKNGQCRGVPMVARMV